MYLNTHPLLSILFSLLILNGFYNLSKIISKNKYFVFLEDYAVQGKVILFFLIINLISILFYNFFLFYGVNEFFLKIIVILLILIGLYKPYNFKGILEKFRLINTKTKLLLFLIIFGYFLISLLPVTDPDSLDYHLTLPYLSLMNGKFFIQKEWFTSQLSGAGEALIILGLSINAYKLSSILQFASLFAVMIAIIDLKQIKSHFNLDSKILICLSILCIPSFLFLTFTAKPQLFPIGTNFIAFLITFFILPFEKDTKKSITIFFIICFLSLCSTQFKFSFFLSTGIILLLAFYEMIKKKLLIKSLFITLTLFVIIVFPREYFDYNYLSKDIIKNFFQPATDDYISGAFVESLKHGTGNPRFFPYWLFVPLHEYYKQYWYGQLALGRVTEIVGFTVLIFLVNFKFKPMKKIIFAVLIFFALAIPFGQPTGRFFIEPFLWLIVGSIYYLHSKNNLLLKVFKKLLIINSIIIFIAIIFTIKNFLPGIFSIESHKNILRKYSEGYQLYEWANKNLPKNSTILTSHRSFLFSENPFISYEFRLYVRNQEELDHFTDLIIKKKPTHLLYNAFDHDLVTDTFRNCRGKLLKVGKNVQQRTTRNPFNRNSTPPYDGYIYEIDLEKLKNCKIKK